MILHNYPTFCIAESERERDNSPPKTNTAARILFIYMYMVYLLADKEQRDREKEEGHINGGNQNTIDAFVSHVELTKDIFRVS